MSTDVPTPPSCLLGSICGTDQDIMEHTEVLEHFPNLVFLALDGTLKPSMVNVSSNFLVK